ncbi:unnamed protein product [Lepeophtheirus salmonis]|uniref:(salmon louse) hypothetical protein n=1 Tax=Lepeophtheirus salmonis TaxID=72036 RepID=A0A7R8H000_LEPSM|nr:unnamed protein product [Lepeophtheirus salmonis]CAF2774960.1 unnamed protein product [Lepeophtheirus salmonis]
MLSFKHGNVGKITIPYKLLQTRRRSSRFALISNNVNSSTLSPPRHFDRNNHSNGGSTTDDYENERTLHSLQGLKVSNSNSSVMPPRSASFHYPEGGKLKLSSSLINFSSDEEEEELESLDLDENISSRQIGSGVHGIPSTSSSSQLLLQQHLLQNRSSLLGANKSQSRKLLTELGGGVSSSESNTVRLSSATGLSSGLGGAKSCLTPKSHQKLEALDNLKVRTSDLELSSIIDTLLYVLDDTDPPVSPSKKTSRELSGTLRNLKKVEQVLQDNHGTVEW